MRLRESEDAMTDRPHNATRAPDDDGFILVAVLWILGGLATLAAIYSLYVVNAATSLQIDNERLQANASAKAALELTAYRLSAFATKERPNDGTFTFRLGGSSVAVGFQTEAARIDLNTAPKPVLAGLFAALGARTDAAEYYADRIVGWRSKSTTAAEDQDIEVTAYRTAGLRYNPRQAPFTSVQELWLVLGLPPQLVEHALPFVTVYSGLEAVNVIDAAPEVLAALPGMTPERLNDVLNLRATLPGDPHTILPMLGLAQGSGTVETTPSYRVTVQIQLPNGRRMRAEAVILMLEDAPDPYHVLSWSDDFDG